MAIVPKLTTKAACRVARLHPDRLNEYIAADVYKCAPATVPGRARLFDPDDMLGLWLFRDLMDDGYSPSAAAEIACAVALAAKVQPEERAISYVQTYFTGGTAVASSAVPESSEWDNVLFSGTDIRKVLTFRIGKTREMIAHYTEEERNIIGEAD